MTPGEHHEVVIVGGGAAGVSCALECFDIRLETVLLEANAMLGGQLTEIPHAVRNVALAGFERGPGLQRSLERSATILGDRVRVGQAVTTANLDERWIEIDGRRVHADALVIASGATRRHHPMAVDGAWGGDVTYQVEREPARFAGRPVAVIGGGDSATLDALELARLGSSVALIHRSEHLAARRDILPGVRKESRCAG